jgi:hypothetical protein
MEKILKFLNKYWLVLTACGTILSTGTVEILKLAGKIDKDIATITALNQWVSDHDDSISELQTKVTRLEALEEARDRVCK